MLAVALSSCGTPQQKASALEENKEAKSLLEGIWLDDNTETALLRVKGDTLFYADAATAPVAFKIIGDSLITYGARTNGYKIEKQGEHIFWFHSAVGDVIRLHKSDTENDSLAFIHTREIPVYNEVIKKDSVVTYDNVRYRGYVYINPSKIKVMRPGVSEEGLGVDNEYYENVLRIISFVDSHDLKALPITNEKWYEIDDKQDLDIAETIFAGDENMLGKFYSRYGGFWRFPQMLDFCYLVNPYFHSSKIIDEMEANFRTLVAEYPSGMKVNTLLASKCWGVKEDYIICGNGAAELIKELMETLTGTLGIIRPTFEEYPNRCQLQTVVTFIPQNNEYRYNIQDLMDFFGSKPVDTLLLINPDNPSGNYISMEDVCILAKWCERHGVRLIVDESFVDFSEGWTNNSLLYDNVLETYPHMIVIKSISKSYGVPGLRLGIMCSADVGLITRMKKAVSIWNINSFAEFFMQIFSKYEKDYKRACEKFISERNLFELELCSIHFLRVMPSQANYFLCEVLPPCSVGWLAMTMLKHYNILIRECSDKEGFDGKQYIRIAVRNHEDNAKLVNAFKEIDEQCKQMMK